MNKEEYLQTLIEQIRCKNVRNPIKKEIENHIEDQMETYIEQGMSYENAQIEALKDMGDPVETGIALDQIHRPKLPWKEMIIIGIFALTGMFLQYFLQKYFQVDTYSPEDNVKKQLIFFIISYSLMIGICYFDYTWIGRYGKEIMIFLSVGILIGRQLWGAAINGATKWIVVGSVSFSIPMLLLLNVPLYASILYSYRGQKYKAIIKSIFWMMPSMFLSLLCRSYYTIIILLFTYTILLTIAILKKWYAIQRKLTLGALWGTLLTLPILVSLGITNYQMQRLERLFNPSNSLERIKAFVSGTYVGSAVIDNIYLPLEDYILTYSITYYGMFAVTLIFVLLSMLFVHLLCISLNQKNQMGMIMGTGCSIVFILEFGIYVLDNMGILFIGSTYCPFLTYGGGGMMVTFMLLGIILSVYRYENVFPEQSGRKRVSIKIMIE